MERKYIESSNLRAVGYERDSGILEIEFNNGYIYQYFDVPEYIYEELMGAESKGKYANKNIYKNFKQQRIN
jgi:hypothetical protein